MKKQYKRLAYILIALSLLVSGWQGLLRIRAEEKYKDLQLAIRYIDVIDAAQQQGEDIETILTRLKSKGATTILVRENTLLPNSSGDLANWKAQGHLTSYEGYELYKDYSDLEDIKNIIKPQLNYILVNNNVIYSSILEEIRVKNLGGRELTLGDNKYIEYTGSPITMSTIGMGFPLEDLEIAANLGYIISPQAKQWPRETEESIESFLIKIENIPSKGVVFFADTEITGAKDKNIIEFAKNNQIGFIEFFSGKQKGLSHLVKKSSNEGKEYKVVKLHTVSDGEATKLSSKEIISRYWLAATERNQQILLFKMPKTLDIIEDFADLEEQLEGFKQKVEKSNYEVSETIGNYNLPTGSFISAFLSGIAPILVFILFAAILKQEKVGIALGILGILGYAGILKLRPNLALQLMALFGASIFPAYAMLRALNKQPKNIKETIVLFLQTCAISFGGALTIIGLLSRTNFGLTLDLFLGVKIAHLIPILLVVIGYIYNEYGFSINFIKELLNKNITYLVAIIGVVLAGILLIYTSRTGNGGRVSDLELAIRSSLDSLLGVRPRTKEFVIGYPILLGLLYYKKREYSIPFIAIAIIGPISLVNTYAHVHTPLLISFIRSGYGILFGLINGLILIGILNQLKKVASKWKPQNE